MQEPDSISRQEGGDFGRLHFQDPCELLGVCTASTMHFKNEALFL